MILSLVQLSLCLLVGNPNLHRCAALPSSSFELRAAAHDDHHRDIIYQTSSETSGDIIYQTSSETSGDIIYQTSSETNRRSFLGAVVQLDQHHCLDPEQQLQEDLSVFPAKMGC